MDRECDLNVLRGLSYVFGVLSCQQDDPICSNCIALVKCVEVAKDRLLGIEDAFERSDVPEEMKTLCGEIYTMLADIHLAKDPIRQKKEGNCTLPEGVCFPKAAIALLEKILV